MSINNDDVRWAYKILLDREPESVEIIDRTVACFTDIKSLKAMIFSTSEFLNANRDIIRALPRIINKTTQAYNIDGQLYADLSSLEEFETYQSTYEEAEIAFVAKHLREGDVFVDVGGGRGIFSVIAASRIGTTGQVYALESDPKYVSLIERNARANGFEQRIRVIQAVLSHEEAEFSAEVSRDTGPATNILRGHNEAEVQHTLDDLFIAAAKINLIKLDLRGAELRAIAGAGRILSRNRPLVLSTVHTDHLMQVSGNSWQHYFSLMSRYGYKPHILDDAGLGKTHPRLEPGRAYSVVFSTTGHYIG